MRKGLLSGYALWLDTLKASIGRLLLLVSLCSLPMPIIAAEPLQLPTPALWPYDPGPMQPYGRPNPAQTDPEARIFDPMMGRHICVQQRTDAATGETTKAKGVWVWSWAMNGYAIRDQYRFGPGAAESLRIFDPKTRRWHVWYFLGQAFYYAGVWSGGSEGKEIVLEKPDETLGDRQVLSRLIYSGITANSFDWKSTNIDESTGEVFVDWTISCQRAIP